MLLTANSSRTHSRVFRAGDTVRVYSKVQEGGKERTQMFEGVVIVRKGGGSGRIDHRTPRSARRRRRKDVSVAKSARRANRSRQARHRFAQPALLPERESRQSGANQGKESQRELRNLRDAAAARRAHLRLGDRSARTLGQAFCSSVNRTRPRLSRRADCRRSRRALSDHVRHPNVLSFHLSRWSRHCRSATFCSSMRSLIVCVTRPMATSRFLRRRSLRAATITSSASSALPATRSPVSNGSVYRNGTALREPYENQPPNYDLAIRQYGIYVNGTALDPRTADIPPRSSGRHPTAYRSGYYFVLGDNRNYSDDSHVWGFVRERGFVGRAFLIIWPLKRLQVLK